MSRKIIDLTGQRFGKWVVLDEHKSVNGSTLWLCCCDCGTEKYVCAGSLRRGIAKSCGCIRKGRPRKELTGQRFGKLVVLTESIIKDKGGNILWLCRCDCGNEKCVRSCSLVSGVTKSCGCGHLRVFAAERTIWNSYKRSAKRRKIEFAISLEEFASLVKQSCYYCGAKPSMLPQSPYQRKLGHLFNGVDRRDNTKGYIIDNCVPCCKNCNIAKQAMTENEFLAWLNVAYHHSLCLIKRRGVR